MNIPIDSVTTEVAKCAFVPLKRHIGYILDRNKNLEEFEKKIERLKNENRRVKNAVDAAERNGETVEEDVTKWLISVDEKINDEAERVKALEEKAKKRCFKGLCPNLKSYYKLGEKAEQDAKVVAELLEQGRFDSISRRLALEGIGTMSVKDYEAFESRASTLEGIMEALRNQDVKMIGVYGMAGVGKTMLVKEVARKVREERLFDEVVMATISDNPNIRRIQGEIADILGLRFDKETEGGRAGRLRQCFQSMNDKKSFLLILDDIWASMDLEVIGISIKADENRAGNDKQGTMMQNIGRSSFNKSSTVGNKILLTSRSQDVLRQMSSPRNFEIRILSQQEAMILFRKIVGDTLEKPEYRKTAEQMVEKVAGLPVAISVIARALKNKGLDIWEDALRQLRSSKQTNIEGMAKEVYSAIKLSYKSLTSKEAQSLLQLCSWAPQGSRNYVPYLLRSSLGLDLLENVHTIKEARNSANALLDKLKASSLLLEGDSNEYVTMHDLVRNACNFITSKDAIVNDEAYFKELLRKGKLNNCKSIYLGLYSKIHEIPNKLGCPKVKFLVLWSEDPLSKVSENFFETLKGLKVLQLGSMSFSSLPKSFVSLTELQTLFLSDCKVHDIAIIGKLKKLDILTLSDCDIKQLPREIGQLTQLRLLDLSNCFKLVEIPEDVISSLTCLEELYMGNSFDRWDVEGNARLAELKGLHRLTTLEVQIPDSQILGRDLFSGNLETYKIFIGDAWDWSDEHGYSRTLKLKLNTSFNSNQGISITILLKNTEELYVDELKEVNSLLMLDRTGFPKLKSLHVQNNSEIKNIIDSGGEIAFPVLESLFLHSLISLNKICCGVDVRSFAELRVIRVGDCNTLKNLFSSSLAIALSKLEEIEVIDCKNMVEIVAAEGEHSNRASNKIELSRLRSLTLQCLPKLISFCSEEETHSISQPAGQTNMRSHSLPLFSEKMLFPCLGDLLFSTIDTESIWSQNQKLRHSNQNLTSLVIENCNNLKHLLSFSMARSLVNLKSLEIIKCKCLREIIRTGDAEEDTATITFPQLNSLKLKDLQHLVGFCLENQIAEFPSLKLLEIENGHELKGFMYNSTIQEHFSTQAFFNEKVAFPSLEKLTVSRLRNMKTIWHNQLFANSFSKLEEMTVEHCNELPSIFPSNILATFQRLHTLTVSNCGKLEEVFELQMLNMTEIQCVSSNLRELYISLLPRLKYIWSKDPQGVFRFENLRVLYVTDCWNLKNVFPASVARALPQLKDLAIGFSGVEEIVSKDERLETDINFEFDQLSSLALWDLPRLKCFYPGKHNTRWRLLKELKAYHCNKLKIFGTERPNLSDMNADGQVESPIQPTLFLVEQDIPRLEELPLNSNDIQVICDTQVSGRLFHETKVLCMQCYHDEPAFFPITVLERFYNLERLNVICSKFKDMFSSGGDCAEAIAIVTYPRIKYLRLAFLNNLRYIWEQDSRIAQILPNLENLDVTGCMNLTSLGLSPAPFTNLKNLDVWGCKALIHLVANSAVQSLVHLEKMVVARCYSMKEIFGKQGDEQTCDIIFSKLKCLELQHLPNLTSFSSSDHTFEFPSLEEVIVSQCPELKIFSLRVSNVPMLKRVQATGKDYKGCWRGDLNSTIKKLYTEKVGYRGMEYLVFSKLNMSTQIWNQNLQRNLDFKSLKFLRVYDCDSVKFIFTVSMAIDLLELGEITVKNCPLIEQIIKNDGAEQRAETDSVMFPCLQFISLESCPNLTSFYLGSNNTMECPSLEEITVVDCSKMFAFASKFLNEQVIETHGGGNMNRLGTAHLFNDQVVSPKLEKLRLSSIEEINKIWHFDLPEISSYGQNLTSLDVKDCHNLKCIFSSSMVESLVQLKELLIANCKNVEEVISTDGLEEAESLSQLLVFPKLEILVLEGLPKLRRFCYGNFLEFPFLIGFRIERCSAFGTFISGFAIENEIGVAEIGVEDNSSAVDRSLSLLNEKVAFPKIERLRIIGGGSWTKIWHDQLYRDSFGKLNLLWVHDCERLLNIFPFNMKGQLEKLEEMEIMNCCSLEEIFGLSGSNVNELHAVTTDQSIRFVFPKLMNLQLSVLPNLKSFCSRIHTTEWPSLKKMHVLGCDKVEIFASENLNFGEISTIQQPLFWVNEVTFPNLEELKLELNFNLKEIWHGQPPERFFCKLKVLELACCLELSATLPHFIVHSLPNLEKLVVNYARFSHIFQCEGHEDEERHGSTMTQLSELKLAQLPALTHIWKEEFQHRAAFYSLKNLEVVGCNKLENLVPSSVSFANLTTLEVSECRGLINLISSTTAKSLTQLTKMSVIDCKMIGEIIASEGDEDGIVFTKLKLLKLSCLPRVESFCSGDHIFEFPVLEQLTVKGCPKMEIFCRGDLRTPKLLQVQLTDDENEENVRWEGNLNITIRKLFDEMVGYQGMEYLEISKFNMSTEIWKQNLERNLDFKILKFLKVDDCDSLKFIFSFSMALDLVHVEEITVKNCPLIEQIIINDGLEQRAAADAIIFPRLRFITLETCSNLTSFFLGSNTLECPSLEEITVADCPKMFSFASKFLTEQDIETVGGGNLSRLGTAYFFNDQVVSSKLLKLRLASMGEINKIWHDHLPEISSCGQNLTSLDVKDCHNLKFIFSSSMVKSLQQLEELFIVNCENVEEVVSVDELVVAETLSQILFFPKLEILVLEGLPKIRRFCYGNFLEFPFLIGFRIERCSSLETFISGENETQVAERAVQDNSSVVDPSLSLFNENVAFPKIERLRIMGGGRWRKIWHDQLYRDSFCKLNLLRVYDCDKLLNIFPFNMTSRLEKLEEMEIGCCNSLEEIFELPRSNVSEVEALTTDHCIRFVFPKLTYLRLSMLMNLKSFCSRIHATEWPSLKKVCVFGCGEVENFASQNLNFGEISTNQRPLFWVSEVTFPNLENLKLELNFNMKDIWRGQLPERFFSKLRVLKLKGFFEESAALPHCFIQSLPNLEKLVVKCAPFSHVFHCDGHDDEERHGSAMTQLSELKLTGLPMLTVIWKEEFQPRAAFNYLTTLEVKGCGKLKNLVPSSVSFANLSTLELSECLGLINLISCLTAKSLMQLTKLSVIRCEKIKEMIAREGDVDGIVFTQLKFLKLSCLPILASFCSGDHIFEFPALEQVIVKQCPEMEIFCRGDLSTPKLQQVQLTDDEDEGNVRWDGSLNTTIRQLFEEAHT